MKILRAAALIVALTLSGLAQSSSDDLKPELEREWHQWFAAFDQVDGATMDSMETPNFVNVSTKGVISQKSAFGLRAGKQKPTGESHTLTDVIVRRFGDTAILTGTVTIANGDSHKQTGTTVVLIRQSGKWLIASAQSSEVPSRQK